MTTQTEASNTAPAARQTVPEFLRSMEGQIAALIGYDESGVL